MISTYLGTKGKPGYGAMVKSKPDELLSLLYKPTGNTSWVLVLPRAGRRKNRLNMLAVLSGGLAQPLSRHSA